MKHSKLAAALATVALFFAGVAFSAEANKTTVRFDQKITVDGKTLDSGKYTAQWTGDGPNVQVTLLHGKDTVPRSQPKSNRKHRQTHRRNRHHRRNRRLEATLSSIYPNGKRISIQLANNGAAGASSSGSR